VCPEKALMARGSASCGGSLHFAGNKIHTAAVVVGAFMSEHAARYGRLASLWLRCEPRGMKMRERCSALWTRVPTWRGHYTVHKFGLSAAFAGTERHVYGLGFRLGAYAPCRDNKIGLSAQAVDAVASPIAGCRAMRLFDLRSYPAAAAAAAVAVAVALE
jgi:hypothetical protein